MKNTELVLLDNLSTQRYSSLYDLPLNSKYSFIEADVIDFEFRRILNQDDIIIHLAAMTDAANSFKNAKLVENNNYRATENAAQACARAGAKLIMISSTSVYGTQEKLISENCSEEELKPQSPYAITKLREEKLVKQISQTENLKSVICRFGTIYGISPGMRFHTAVNKFCWQAVMGMPLTVWRGAYEQKRPYLNLNDAVNALELIIRKDLFKGDVYNVLSQNLSVKDVITTIQAFIPNLKIDFVNHEVMNQLSYEVSFEKFSALGYTAKGNLRKNIKSTIDLLKQSNTHSSLTINHN
jgi:nucleoside-diphosphate-sugar epimerase